MVPEGPLKKAALGLSLGLLLSFWGVSLPLRILLSGLGFLGGPTTGVFALGGMFYGAWFRQSRNRPFPSGRISGRIVGRSTGTSGVVLRVKLDSGARGEILSRTRIPECTTGSGFEALVRPASGHLNPFGPPLRMVLLTRGLSFRAYLRGNRILCFPSREGFLESLRDRLDFFSGGLSPPARGLFRALILGEKTDLPGDLEDRIQELGIYHFLAVSGFHLGLLYGFLFWGARFLWPRIFPRSGLPAQVPAAWVGLAGAFLYALLSGLSPSTQRALLMLLLYTLARSLFRRVSGPDLLAGAVLLALLWKPYWILHPSFRLSVMAVIGVLLGHRWSRKMKIENRPVRFLLEGFLISLGAWLFTLPFVLWYFGRAAWTGPLNTLIFSPLWCLVIIPGEMLAALGSFLSPEKAAHLAETLAGILEYALRFPIPCPSLLPPFPVGMLVLALGFLLLGGLLYRDRRGVAGVLAAGALGLFLLGWMARERLFWMVALDLGKANAVAVHLPGNRNLLFDAGARFGSVDLGKYLLVPALEKMGLSRLDLVVLSHPDLDHAGGVPALERSLPVKKILSGSFRRASWERVSPGFSPLSLRSFTRERVGEAEVWLFPGRPRPPERLENREGLVGYLEFRGLSLFFPGDIDRTRLRRMERVLATLPAEILILPHHGARNGFLPSAWKALKPRVALALARGRHHPHREVRGWLKREKIPLYITGQQGAIFVFLKGKEFLVCTMEDLTGGLPKTLLWPYIPYVISGGCHSYALHTLRDL